MGFGPRFELPHKVGSQDVTVVMRPAREGDGADMARYLEDFTVQQFVLLQGGMTPRDEDDYLEKARTNADVILWVVTVKDGDTETLVGVTGLVRQAGNRLSSGILFANRDYWQQGIAGLTHRLRTWYAFCELGAYAINSSYVEENAASGRALRSVGYIETGRDWRCHLTAGRWRDEVKLVCYNPHTVSILWPDGDVPAEVQVGLQLTSAALDRATDLLELR
jgi:RimJ/RimL family protein N-acetyltransferase